MRSGSELHLTSNLMYVCHGLVRHSNPVRIVKGLREVKNKGGPIQVQGFTTVLNFPIEGFRSDPFPYHINCVIVFVDE